MWPLPAHIDSVAAYNTVPAALDVDGAHFVGHSQLRAGRRDARDPNPNPNPNPTPTPTPNPNPNEVEPANLFIAALPAERRWVMSGTPTVDGEGTSGAEGALMQVRVRVRARARARVKG